MAFVLESILTMAKVVVVFLSVYILIPKFVFVYVYVLIFTLPPICCCCCCCHIKDNAYDDFACCIDVIFLPDICFGILVNIHICILACIIISLSLLSTAFCAHRFGNKDCLSLVCNTTASCVFIVCGSVCLLGQRI